MAKGNLRELFLPGQNSQRALPQRYLLHGRYTIGSTLGEGGFGITYRAWDERENCRVALKEYMPAGISDRVTGAGEVFAWKDREHFEKYMDRFLEEAQIIYQYRGHPNIVEVKHLFRENNTAYYAMEYLDGSDLRHLLQRQPGLRAGWEVLKPLFSQTVHALRTVHQSGIVHCDVSPDNIVILRKSGQVKLIDFGAAKTRIGGVSTQIVLKRGYAPPEQFSLHGDLGPWSDIYALAVTIYSCLTGQLPPSAIERLSGAREKTLSEFGVRVPEHFNERALQKAMALPAKDRYRDVGVFWSELTGETAGGESGRGTSGSAAAKSRSLILLGRTGIWENRRFRPEPILYAGKALKCRIHFPPEMPGVGNIHFRVWSEPGKLLLTDMGSGCATYLDYKRITPGLVYELRPGSGIRIGENQIFEVMEL